MTPIITVIVAMMAVAIFAMAIMFMNVRSPAVRARRKMASCSVAMTGNYATATKPTLTFTNLHSIESLNDVSIWVDGLNMLAVPTAISGNVVTVKLLWTGAGLSAVFAEVTDGTAIGAGTLRGWALGV